MQLLVARRTAGTRSAGDPHATIAVDGVKRQVAARELSGSDRESGYRRGEEIFPGFTHYRRWSTSRQIPVLRLEPLP